MQSTHYYFYRDPKDPSKVVLTVKYPDYTPVMEDCTVCA